MSCGVLRVAAPFAPPSVNVSATYPGASAQTVSFGNGTLDHLRVQNTSAVTFASSYARRAASASPRLSATAASPNCADR